MNIRRIIQEEIDSLDWIRDIEPNKWDYFEELIKDIPQINIEKNKGGEWIGFKDEKNMSYFGYDFFIDYELDEDIKSNPLPYFLDTVSQHIEITFSHYDEDDKDYWDFRLLEEILEKANKTI